MLQWPLTLRVPLPLAAPWIRPQSFTLRWILRAVVGRPLGRDSTTIEAPVP